MLAPTAENSWWAGLLQVVNLESETCIDSPVMRSICWPIWPIGEYFEKDMYPQDIKVLLSLNSVIGCLNFLVVVIFGTPLYPNKAGGWYEFKEYISINPCSIA